MQTLRIVIFNHMQKTYELPDDGHKLRPKHIGALIINKLQRCAKQLVLNFICVM